MASALGACGNPSSKLDVEKLPEIRPNLPAVPQIPPPPYPIQYPDQSYSVYGVRNKAKRTIDQDVEVTGYIVKIYQPPECPAGRSCPLPQAPNLWIGDIANETDDAKLIMLTGYAENHLAIEEAVAAAKRGRPIVPDPESGLLAVPSDFFVGAKVKVKGRFAYVSGSGFNNSDGLLDYRGHQTLVPAPAPTE